MVPFHMHADAFGAEVAAHFAPFAESRRFLDYGANTIVRPEIPADEAPITPDAVWWAKARTSRARSTCAAAPTYSTRVRQRA